MKIQDYRQVPAMPIEEEPGVTVRRVITGRDGAPHFAMRVFEIEPGAATHWGSHWWEHEVFVLDGEGAVKNVDGEVPIMGGTVVFVAPDEMHQFINKGNRPLRLICVVPHH